MPSAPDRAHSAHGAHGAPRTDADLAGLPALPRRASTAEAVAGASAVHADTWVSMGQEDAKAARKQAFEGFTVDGDLMALAAPEAVFMHCLPAFHDKNTKVGGEVMGETGMDDGLEVTDEVFESPASIVFDQAENRLHTIKALLVATLA